MPDVLKQRVKPRRRGGENSEKRTLLIDCAERLMIDEGHGAVTTRRLASKAGLKSQLVHYYFKTIDDVFVAVIRRRATKTLERMVAMVDPSQTFEAEWNAHRDTEELSFWRELAALANQRPGIRSEAQHYTAQKRLLQSSALERSFQRNGIRTTVPSIAWILLIVGSSHVLAMESMLGLTYGHKETMELLRAIMRDAGTSLQSTTNASKSKRRSAAPSRQRANDAPKSKANGGVVKARLR